MEVLLEILKLTIPPAIVFVTAYVLIRKFVDNEDRRAMIELQKINRNVTLPVRMQAYERTILYLERIDPNNLVMRVHKPGMSARLMHSEMIKAIREEFGHNMSQQIYLSNNAWEMVRNAKEEMIKLTNIAQQNTPNDADSIKMAEVVFEMVGKLDRLPTQIAMEYVKKEVHKLM